MPSFDVTARLMDFLPLDAAVTARQLARETGFAPSVVAAGLAQLLAAGHASRVGNGVFARSYRDGR